MLVAPANDPGWAPLFARAAVRRRRYRRRPEPRGDRSRQALSLRVGGLGLSATGAATSSGAGGGVHKVELRAPVTARTDDDPHAQHAGSALAGSTPLPGWLLALNPVSLYRLTALSLSPRLRPRLGLAIPGFSGIALEITLAAGWLVWLLIPRASAHWIFRRADLS